MFSERKFPKIYLSTKHTFIDKRLFTVPTNLICKNSLLIHLVIQLPVIDISRKIGLTKMSPQIDPTRSSPAPFSHFTFFLHLILQIPAIRHYLSKNNLQK